MRPTWVDSLLYPEYRKGEDGHPRGRTVEAYKGLATARLAENYRLYRMV